jgi:hypothetical protein
VKGFSAISLKVSDPGVLAMGFCRICLIISAMRSPSYSWADSRIFLSFATFSSSESPFPLWALSQLLGT